MHKEKIHGSFLKIADIARHELVQGLGIVSKRIPAWLLLDADLRAAGISPARRNILRPDIMLIESSFDEQTAYASTATAQELSSQVGYHVPKALQPKLPKGSRRPPETDRPLPRPRIIWLLSGGVTQILIALHFDSLPLIYSRRSMLEPIESFGHMGLCSEYSSGTSGNSRTLVGTSRT